MVFRRRRKFTRRRAMPLMATRKYVRSQIKRDDETKVHATSDTTDTDVDNSAPIIRDLSAVPEGTGEEQRIGVEIKPQRLEIRYEIDSNVGTQTNMVRVFVLSTRIPGTPTVGQFLLDTTVAGVMVSPVDPIQQSHKVLYDRVHNMNDSVSTEKSVKYIKKVFSAKQLPKIIHFDLAATTAPKNKLWLVVTGNGTTAMPQIASFGCLEFKD